MAPTNPVTHSPAPEATDVSSARPLIASLELRAIVGAAPLSHVDVIKRVWDHVKEHHLQDVADTRTINADEKLKAVFGGRAKVSMFELPSLLTRHLSPSDDTESS